ncbi:MAG: S8 family serine peptidase [Deltaproteobacteria bacterium]
MPTPRTFLLTATLTSLAVAAWADGTRPDRPAWERPKNGVRLAARDVFLDRGKPVPDVGAAFYVFAERALTRTDVADAKQVGLRYLGTVTAYVYVFQRAAEHADADAYLEASWIRGTAKALPIDRVDEEVLPYFAKDEPLPHPLVVAAWSETTAGEIAALIPGAEELRRLPTDPNEAIREECHFHVADRDLLKRLATSPFVASIGFDWPNKSHNTASRRISHADALVNAPYNLDGTGVVVGHWDGGSVSSSHQDFGGRVTNYESRGVSSHATHTAGTILGSGSGDRDAQGFAPGATMVAYDFYGDAAAERREAKHDHYHEHDNHSWGSTSTNFGSYAGSAQEWDLDSRDLFLLGMKAAGNEGRSSQVNDNNYGFDSLPPDSTAKNLLVVGATDDDGDLTSFSSRGPTNDGRIKPDISANGQNLYSVMPSGRYGSMSGTSMSTPSVTGMVTLLAELYKREFAGERLTPDLVRVIMIHTVTDVFHRGPDYRHGWGNADAQAAANLILADAAAPGTRLARAAVRDGETYEYEMDVTPGSNEVRVTLSWLDAYANSTAQRRLINDLDLELISPSGQTYYPWTLDAANPFDDAVQNQRNDLDNVEQVLVESPEDGVWTVRIAGTNIPDPNFDIQGFTLATSHSVARTFEKVRPDLGPNGAAIPDNDTTGLVVDLDVQDARDVKSLRVRVEIRHPARGNLEINLVHPDGTRSNLEKADTSTRRDIFAIYPDTRSYDEDVTMFYGRSGQGTWKLEVIDGNAGQTGTLVDVSLELDLEGPPPPPPNVPPTADAGDDQTVNAGDPVALDGSGSNDADGDTLVYLWQQQSGVAVSLGNASTVAPSFTAPSVKETTTLVFRLNVDDGNGGMASDDVAITIIGEKPEGSNRAPIARVADDFTVGPGFEVGLDATQSEDPDGDPITFNWTQTAGADVEILRASEAYASFVSPNVDEATTLTFQVEVTDDSGEVDLATINVTVEPGAPPPPTVRVPLEGLVGGSCRCVERGGSPWWLLFGLVLFLRRRS